jgi:hypothetical protein
MIVDVSTKIWTCYLPATDQKRCRLIYPARCFTFLSRRRRAGGFNLSTVPCSLPHTSRMITSRLAPFVEWAEISVMLGVHRASGSVSVLQWSWVAKHPGACVVLALPRGSCAQRPIILLETSFVLKIDFFIRTGKSKADQCLIRGNPPKRPCGVRFCITDHVSEVCQCRMEYLDSTLTAAYPKKVYKMRVCLFAS